MDKQKDAMIYEVLGLEPGSVPFGVLRRLRRQFTNGIECSGYYVAYRINAGGTPEYYRGSNKAGPLSGALKFGRLMDALFRLYIGECIKEYDVRELTWPELVSNISDTALAEVRAGEYLSEELLNEWPGPSLGEH